MHYLQVWDADDTSALSTPLIRVEPVSLNVSVQALARFRRLSSRRRIEIKESHLPRAKRGFDTPLSGLLNRRLAYPLNAYD